MINKNGKNTFTEEKENKEEKIESIDEPNIKEKSDNQKSQNYTNLLNSYLDSCDEPKFLHMFSRENILNALLDQKQTIYLQKQLRTINKEIIDYIIAQLKGLFREIIKDKNGNYFCSDLFKECDQEQRIKILKELSPTLSDDCLNKYGTYAIQALIDRASSEIEYKLILVSFNDNNKLLYVSLDANGAYTVQKIIERIPEKFREEFNFIFSSFIGFISRKKYGIFTVKKFISVTIKEHIIEQVMNLVKNNFMNLSMDQYAYNLIIFLLKKLNDTSDGNDLKNLIKSNFEQLSRYQYSSLICESYIKIISREEKVELIVSLNKSKMRVLSNHNTMKILKLLENSINNNLNINHHESNNMNNYDYYMSNRNNSNNNIQKNNQASF